MKVLIANYTTQDGHDYAPGDEVSEGDSKAKRELPKNILVDLINGGYATKIDESEAVEDGKKPTTKSE